MSTLSTLNICLNLEPPITEILLKNSTLEIFELYRHHHDATVAPSFEKKGKRPFSVKLAEESTSSLEIPGIFVDFSEMSEKTFDLQLEKYSSEILQDVLSRIMAVDNAKDVMIRLPNRGQDILQFKFVLEEEFTFREGLNKTKARMEEMVVKCASDTNVGAGYDYRLSSFDKSPVVPIPILPIPIARSGRSESTPAIPDEEKELAALNEGFKATECHLRGVADCCMERWKNSSFSSSSSSDSEPPEFFQVLPREELELFQTIENAKKLEEAVKNYVFKNLTKENQYDAKSDGPEVEKLQNEAAAVLPEEKDNE